MYLASLGGAIYTAFFYDKYLGDTSPIQGWIDENATSYSTDIYDTILSLKEVSLAHSQVQADKQLPMAYLTEKVELFRGMLETFNPSSVAGERVDKLPSAHEALKSARQFVDLVSKWATTRNDRGADKELAAAEEKALFTMRKLTVEALDKEFQSRDEMKRAIISSRLFANKAFKIAILLYIFGAVALGSVYWASGAWVAAERARFKRLEYLLATVGHELRSPLQAIVSAAQLLRRIFSAGENATYVEIIRDSSRQLARLVDDLVDLARNEELSFDPQPIDMTYWLGKIAARYSVDAESKGLKFIADAATLPSIVFDEDRLTQCIGNLLSNAIRYTSAGSIKLTIDITHLTTDEGILNADVEDTGPGVPAKERERIFRPFVRVATDTAGMGLGLAIVSSIVRTAGGRVFLKRSEPSKGSVFSLELPVKFANAQQANQKSSEQSSQAIRPRSVDERVLIVDDDQSIRTVLSAVVAEMGYSSDQAADGDEAFQMALETQYYAILTDIQMPVRDGFELAQACRDNLQPCPALIAMTAYTKKLSGDPRARIFDKTLSKPVDDEVLLNVLENVPSH